MDYKKVLQYTQELDVLYVEDDIDLLENTQDILEDYFSVLDTAINGKIALDKYNQYFKNNNKHYDLIITDISMPIMDGATLIKNIIETNPEQAIIVVSAHGESGRLIKLIQDGITNFILKPIEPEQLINILYKTCKNIFAQKRLKLFTKMLDNENKNLDKKVQELSKEILATQRLSVETIGNMIESYDDDTGSHVKRIEAYVELLIYDVSPNNPQLEQIKEVASFASLLHDIGKIVIPKHILTKPDKLDANEFDIIKTHAKIGGEMLLKANESFKAQFGKNSFFKVASDIAYYHHEKFNGNGYPKGLQAKEIPLAARIVAIADVYDALRSKRVYKDGFSHEESVEIIKRESGNSFDPELVDIFLKVNNDFNNIFERLA